MTRHLLTGALFAGLAAGLLATLLQLTFVVPLLLQGEAFESGLQIHFSATGSPQSEVTHPDIWAEMSRNTGTLAMNLVTYTGFALLMVAGFALAERSGAARIDARRGAIWGLGAFVAVQLAPAFGLPPELPGTIGAEVGPRQIWWLGCVAATLAGLAAFAYGRGAVVMGAGVLLIAAPHLIGAPTIDTYFGVAPPELASLFVARSLGVAAMSWVLLGVIAGALWSRPEAT
jgi:cobalt transporter subunit CbtA